MEDRDYILFEDYLTNELDEGQKANFEKRLKEDNDFREAFELYQSTSHFLSYKFSNAQEREDFKRNLSKISESYSGTNKVALHKTRYFKPWKLAIAASLLVIMGVFYSQWFSSSPQYQDFAQYPQISLTVRGDSNALISEAEQRFNAQNYSEAIPLFKRILQNKPENLEIQLYLAIALVENEDFGEADSIFNALLNSSSVYLNQVRWYAALSQLKQENYNASKSLLQQIPADAEEYAKAQELLDEL
jgi:tetratricopeptide (TPR) repeat protein